MRRFTEVIVRVGCRARCRKAGAPTVILPSSAMQTALGVLRLPFSSASRMGKAAVHDADEGVRRAEVDAEDGGGMHEAGVFNH
jgi:hypothetical protein